jgi:uracil-DNA glycosylase
LNTRALDKLLSEVRACRTCEAQLPLGPNPVLRASNRARILVIGQAPGTRVHQTGIPWNDPSGDRLRDWMQLDRERFYDEQQIAIIPMGFCYPGKGKSGDLPPRPECAPQWHPRLLAELSALKLTILIGQYAQQYYLDTRRRTLAATVQDWCRTGRPACRHISRYPTRHLATSAGSGIIPGLKQRCCRPFASS